MILRRPPLEERLSAYLSGELDPAARAAVEDLLRDDPQARTLLEEVRAARTALLALRDRPEPPVHADDVLHRIQAAISNQRFERRPRLYLEGVGSRHYRPIALAASVLCAVSLGLWWNGHDRPDSPAAPARATGERAPSAGNRPLRVLFESGEMSAAEYLRILDETGAQPDQLRDSPFDRVLPISLEAPIAR